MHPSKRGLKELNRKGGGNAGLPSPAWLWPSGNLAFFFLSREAYAKRSRRHALIAFKQAVCSSRLACTRAPIGPVPNKMAVAMLREKFVW